MPKIKIESVKFEGAPELLSSIRGSLHASLRRKERIKNSNWVEELENEVRGEWQEHGFYQASVRVEVQVLNSNARVESVAATFHVKEGKKYRLKDIEIGSFEGEPQHFPSVELRDLIPLRPGEFFILQNIRDGLVALNRKYGRAGYIDSVAEPQTEVDEVDGTILLRVHMNQGAQFRIAEVKVPGNPQLEAQARSKLRGGQIFDPLKLEKFIADNKARLPKGFTSAKVEVSRDLANSTVSLYFDLRSPNCPNPDSRRRCL